MTSYLNLYPVALCKLMIADYERQAADEDKSPRWRELARCSAADWRERLQQAEA